MQDSSTRRKPHANKSKYEKRVSSQEAKSSTSSFKENAGYISTFILIMLTLLIYEVIFLLNADSNVNFQALKTELVNNVHKQTKAVSAIIRSLDKIENHEGVVSVINFVGSTGVGKTFVVNILKKHFLSSLYEFRSVVDSQEKILSTINDTSFRYNLIVFDDLTVGDLDFLGDLFKKISPDVNVLVVCIFNIQETDQFLNYTINYDHIDIIEDKFNKSGIIHETAKFHEFTPDQAKEWIVKQLIIKGVDAQPHSEIVETLLANHNVKYHGLKGLESKLNLEL